MRALHRVGRWQPRELTAVGDKLNSRQARNLRVVLRHVAEAGTNVERHFGDVEAQHPIPPESGAINPSSAFSIVLLPAPFGPSSPTAPGGNVADTSESANCAP